jgi:hypothetical protein
MRLETAFDHGRGLKLVQWQCVNCGKAIGVGEPAPFAGPSRAELSMPKRTSKQDMNVTAFEIVRAATNPPQPAPPSNQISQIAAALGRLGGLKGGPARAKKLSQEERSQIAQKAAHARWSCTRG